jgi:L-ascorbate metabolism protein UlaG (beta-lactamase superfamily)
MKLTWYGHAAFGIEGSNDAGERLRVIFDPYNHPGAGGYLPIDESADVVSISHENPRYHSDLSAIRGAPAVLRGLEYAGAAREARGLRFEAFQVFENAERAGPNAMVKVRFEGIRIAHQGDLGHPIEGPALDFLRGVDILLALAGGPPTLDLADLLEIIDETRPRLVVPMHYKTPKVNLALLGVDHFLRLASDYPIERPGRASVEIRRASLPKETTVLVLDHAR